MPLTWLRRLSTSGPPSRLPPLQPQGSCCPPTSRAPRAHSGLRVWARSVPSAWGTHPRPHSSLSPDDLPSERLCLTARPNTAAHTHLALHPPTRGFVLQQRFIIAGRSEMYLCDFLPSPAGTSASSRCRWRRPLQCLEQPRSWTPHGPGGRGAPCEEFERLSSFQTCPPPPGHRAVPLPTRAPQLSSRPAETILSAQCGQDSAGGTTGTDSPCSEKRWQHLQGVAGDEPSVCVLSQAGEPPAGPPSVWQETSGARGLSARATFYFILLYFHQGIVDVPCYISLRCTT